MAPRPVPLVAAVVLLVVIGLSGLSAGLGLLGITGGSVGVPGISIAIGTSIAAYGALVTIAGIDLFRGGRRGWRLAVGTIGAGLLFLVGLSVGVGEIDGVFAFGIVVWSLTLAVLVAPATRAALRP